MPGPGLIRPPVTLTYSKPSQTLITWDSAPNSGAGYLNLWGSFDNSTNAPIYYPLATTATDLSLNLHLMRNETEIGNFSWHFQLTPNDYIRFHTSTNLVNWIPTGLIFQPGWPVEWYHYVSDPQRYFKMIPSE
jgi:hypothetical protein